jgi:DNA/RNA endonuclease YhcR with UshA esterase domain
MDRRVMLAVATVLSFTGVLGLYFYSCSVQPILVQIGDVGAGDVGSVVKTRGHIMELYQTSAGDVMLEMVNLDDGASITVYIPENVFSEFGEKGALISGAEIEAVGEVQEYQGEMELVIDSATDLVIIQYPNEADLTIEMLAGNPELFLNRDVTVPGQIQNIVADRMWRRDRLVDATVFQLRYSGKYANFTIDCILFGTDVSNDFHQGQLVRFSGIFEYYEKETKYRIVSDGMTLHS